MWDCCPQFLCNSCDLQMKLFKKLKDKAHKTFEYLMQMHGEVFSNGKPLTGDEHTEAVEESVYQEKDVNDAELNEEHLLGESHSNDSEGEEERESHCDGKENYTQSLTSEVEGLSVTNEVNRIEICAIVKEDFVQVDQYTAPEPEPMKAASQCSEETAERENLVTEFEIPIEDDVQTLSEDKLAEITLELDTSSVIDKNDYVTEIYVTDNEHNNKLEEYEALDETNSESTLVFNDVEYVLEETSDSVSLEQEDAAKNMELKELNAAKKRKTNNGNRKNPAKVNATTTTKKREYKCGPCQLELKTMQEFRNHRIEVHAEKYPCSVCSKELKSLAALHTHMKLHSDRKPFHCELCGKSFNQKAHYQYHMNRHNNVRNFKCTICDKGCLSKADLNVHMRSHTGQRPYVCDICGKDYLMMEHLKAHALIHSQEYFQCDICQHKFATHKTLRTHIKTIHEDEPRFKCNFCEKAFRRKHHLEVGFVVDFFFIAVCNIF